jgi:hypothetical protein
LDEVGASCKPKGPQDAAQCANEILWRFKTAANHSLDEINFFASLLRANRDYFPAWLGTHSAKCRKSRRRNTETCECGKVECGTGEDRKATGAQCPRVRLVLGDVIDIGESLWRRKPPL